MSIGPGWRRVFRLPVTRESATRDVDDELAFHIAMREEKLRKGGLPPDEASKVARKRFGDVDRVREELVGMSNARVRRDGATDFLEQLGQDLSVAARGLARARGFTAIALLTLAIGIGATASIFSVVYGVLLRPLPFAEPHRIVHLFTGFPALGLPRGPWSAPEYLDIASGTRSLAEVGAYDARDVTLTGAGRPERIRVGQATASLFRTLAVPAAIGRVFNDEEDRPGGAPVVVLSHALWQRLFAGDRDAVGMTVRLDDVPRTITGVMPRDFTIGELEAFVPLALDPANTRSRGAHYLDVIGRLRPGATVEQLRTELGALATRTRADYPQQYQDPAFNMTAMPLREAWVGDMRPTLLVLVGAVLLLLLLACANVANLLLVRAEARQREIAVRVALGATRARLVRQLLTESLLLTIAGAAIGLPLAAMGTRALLALSPGMVPPGVTISVDTAVLLATVVLVAVTTLLAGLVPALQGTATDVRTAISAGGLAGGSRGGRLRSVLVTAEIAIATVVLVGAALVGRSFWQLQQVDPGFRPERVLSLDVALPQTRYPDPTRVPAFFARMTERAMELPGVQRAAVVSHLPLSGRSGDWMVDVEGRPTAPGQPLPSPSFVIASAGYFETMGIPIVAGRPFADTDGERTGPVVVVSAEMARTMWPDENPIGRRMRLQGGGEVTFPWMEVIGVAGGVRSQAVGTEARETYYLLDSQFPGLAGGAPRDMTLLLRTAGDPLSLAASARQAVWELDPELAIANVRPLEQVVQGSMARPRFVAAVLSMFGAAALALAVIGVYGVLSFAVARRQREMGIRMALGARSAQVQRLVMGTGFRLAALGIVLGLGGAFASTRIMSAVLYDVSATDPMILAAVAVLLAAAALAASYVPARRATLVNPAEVLRRE